MLHPLAWNVPGPEIGSTIVSIAPQIAFRRLPCDVSRRPSLTISGIAMLAPFRAAGSPT